MTTQATSPTEVSPVEMITVVIDGFEVTVPKGTLIIRAAEKLGIQIPRFCDHPLLDPDIGGNHRGTAQQGIDLGHANRQPIAVQIATVRAAMNPPSTGRP